MACCKNPEWRRTCKRLFFQLLPVIIMLLSLILITLFMEQSMAGFVVGDPSLSYPIEKQTLTTIAAAAMMFIYPFVCLVVHTFFKARAWGKSFKDGEVICYWWNKTWCAVLVGFVFILFSEFMKRFVGKLRPNFLAMCQPVYDISQGIPIEGGEGVYISNYTCSGTSAFPQGESARSFPSGHSMFAVLLFAAMGNLFEAANWREGDDKLLDPTWATRLVIQFVLTLIVGPAISLTRFTEHFHSGFDVLTGIILGYLAFAVLLMLEGCVVKVPKTSRSDEYSLRDTGAGENGKVN